MPAAIQLQFGYKFVSVNTIDADSIRIRCASGECEFNSHSNRIKCEKAFRLSWWKFSQCLINFEWITFYTLCTSVDLECGIVYVEPSPRCRGMQQQHKSRRLTRIIERIELINNSMNTK